MMRKMLGVILMAATLSTMGCTYVQNRVEDGLDMIDVGLSFSSEPQFALFVDAPFATIWPIGYANVDGRFIGIGQGHLRFLSPYYTRDWGVVLYGSERVSFNANYAELEAMGEEELKREQEFYRTGFAGFVQGPFPPPKYLVSCPHYVHLGWVGFVLTPRYWEAVDFLLGFTTLDASWDDDCGESLDAPAI